MKKDNSNGTAARATGVPPSPKKKPKTRSGRWELSNAIDDNLGWIPHPEYRVLRTLFRYAGESREAWPSQNIIGRSCGIDRSHVSKCLGRLVSWDVIELVRRGHKGSRQPNVYRINSHPNWKTERPPD